jgi:Putative restriction endonuclease
MALRADDPRLAGVDEDWWEAFEAPPGHRAEIIEGTLVVTPSPAPRHAVLQSRLYDMLRPFIPEDLLLVSGLEWRLAKQGLVAAAPQPDLMVIRLPDPEIAVLTETPLLTVEIVSPADGSRLRSGLTRQEAKRVDYSSNGVRDHLELWFDAGVLVIDRFEFTDDRKAHMERVSTGAMRVYRPFDYLLDTTSLWSR